MLREGRILEVRMDQENISGIMYTGPLKNIDELRRQMELMDRKEIGQGSPLPRPKRPSLQDLLARLKRSTNQKDNFVLFSVVRVNDPKLVEELDAQNVEYSGVQESMMGKLLWGTLVPILFWVGLWFLLLRGMGRPGTGMLSFGKSKAKVNMEKDTGVRFDDVAGCEESKEELAEVVEFLKQPGKYEQLGAKIPKGVLLLGPPGTGKTLLARALAGEARVPFYSISGSEFVEMFVGVGAARVRDLFNQAKQNAPCIIFIDEIDAIGKFRSGGMISGGHEEREQTLNQLLVEMDGFEPNLGVILLAATNRPEVLDPALLRPGRFDRQVVLDAPDARGREAILQVHSRDKPLDPDVNLKEIALRTPGFSGADLANVMNEAALIAAKYGDRQITQNHLEEAVEKVMAGPERKSRRLGDKERRRVAYHESGHALVAYFCSSAPPVAKISIIPRGKAALGYTLQLPEEEQFLMTKSELTDKICVSLGGRAAEELVLGEVSSGAQNDLEVATEIARSMVCRFGMSKTVGPMALSRDSNPYLRLPGMPSQMETLSPELASEVDREVRKVLSEQNDRAHKIIEEHLDALDRVTEHLLVEEVMSSDTFKSLIEGRLENHGNQQKE
ncbi:MAG TPA: ATP-dependent zinc metalloprotease FtsH [Thermodesulfobacteriaceae bacterium]|nr:ATP-dependent zinc metalloprotease FtsH [Thermodesulfobacteriaceae bacterium]